jgi:hypothetical protein
MRIPLLSVLVATTLSAQSEPPYPLRPLQETRVIGAEAAGGVFLASIRSVAVATNGDVYVLDGQERDIKRYDAAGRFIARFGSQGVGPGELRTPLTVTLRDSVVHVLDQSNGYVEYAGDGTHIRTTRTRPDWLDNSRVRHGHAVIVDSDMIQRPVGPPVPVTTLAPMYRRVMLRNSSGGVDTIAVHRLDMGIVTLNAGSAPPAARPIGFGSQGVHSVIGDSTLVVADGYAAEVRWYAFTPAGATLRKTASLRQTSRLVTRDDLTEAGVRLAGQTVNMSGTAGAMTRSALQPTAATVTQATERWSVATRMLVANDGAVAVAAPLTVSQPRENKSTVENNVYTVFPATGAPFRVTLPGSQYLHLIHAGEFYVSDRNDDEPVIRVLRPR